MKKLCCLLAVSLAFAQMVSAGDLQPDKETVAVSEKVYCSATLEDDFLDDSVIVVINKEVSNQKQQFTVADFELSTVSEVKNLTGDVTGYDTQDSQVLSKSFSADSVIEQEGHKDIVVLELETKGKQNVLDTIKQLEELDFVESAEPNYLFSPDDILADDSAVMYADSTEEQSQFPNDIYRSYQYALDKISIEDVWRVTTGSSTVRVGVIDSGIASHSELNANVTTGWDFVNQNSATRDDPSGHGTHIAGIIGAIGNNFFGVCGLNWEVELVPLQVAEDDEYFSVQAIIQAVQYATVNNIPIINCSFGDEEDSNALEKAIAEYPGVVVCAAGNNRQNTDSTPHYPSGYNCDNIISVAATGESDDLWLFSNYGAATVDIGAPGVSIYSTVLNNVYDYKSGTSMAAPYVTGVAALIKSVRPEMSAIEIKNCILQGATPIEALSGKCVTGGLLNAKGAFVKAGIITQQTLTGDFNGDGREDLALFESYPSADTAIRVRLATGSSYSAFTTWWRSGAGVFDMSWVGDRLTAGDFDGDNQDEIAVFYGYADNRMNLIVFDPQSDNTFQKAVWKSYPAGSWEAFRLNGTITSGNFASNTGNIGKDEIVGVYQYAAGNVKFFMWQFSTVNSTPTMGHTVCKEYAAGDFSTAWMQGLTTAGDINDDGYEEYMVGYGYSDYAFKILYYRYNATSSTFNSGMWYSAPAGSYDVECMRNRFVFVNFSDVAYKEIGIIYQRNNGNVDFILMNNTTNNRYLCQFTSAQYNASLCAHIDFGDTNGDEEKELIVVYEYPAAVYRLFGYTPSADCLVYD